MNYRTPCQMILGSAITAIALTVLSLAADNVSYVNKHQSPSPVAVHYTRWNETAQQQYSYWLTMDYLPSNFSIDTMTAMIVASLICGIVGVSVAVGSWLTRGTTSLQTGFSSKTTDTSSMPFLPISLVLTTAAFITSLAVSIYVWHPVAKLGGSKFLASLPLPPHFPAKPLTGSVTYSSPIQYTPEFWNCLLAPYVVEPATGRRMQNLCQEAGIARYLMFPILILSATLLFSLLWTWRQARLTAATDASDVEAKEIEIETVSVRAKE